MNIKITYNWLLEYLETDATPYEIQKYLSLSGPSVEKVEKVEDDYVFDIEVTSNRVDMASVFGIAQECLAILPRFNKKARLKNNPLTSYRFEKLTPRYSQKYSLNVFLKDSDLCSRFSALIFENVKIKKSPPVISKRLTLCGIRSINNVVDISNYLMLSLGQPVHVFDFDQIKKATMIMRRSRPGEKIITLDDKEIKLPGNDIVIEDGQGRLIDLCGIMGGANSAVSEKTNNILLFVQTYNKNLIRKTTMLTSQRTDAATLFEKGLDEERVEPTLVYGAQLLEDLAQAKIASLLIDIYPRPYQEKKVSFRYPTFSRLIGIKISETEINNILTSLGFKIYKNAVGVPSWRQNDINIEEDLVEEVARIYGYQRLPSNLPPLVYLKQPVQIEKLFKIQNKIKYLLKHLGLNEVLNYSMISKSMIASCGLSLKNHLRLINSISEELTYLRNSLVPSLIKNIKENQGRKDELKLFEIAKVYLPKKNDLPEEHYKLAIAVNTDYFDLKGIVETILKELNITTFPFEIKNYENIFVCEIDLQKLIDHYRPFPTYKPVNPYAVIKLDKNFQLSQNLTYAVIQRLAQRSKYLQKMEVISLYKDRLTIRFYYAASDHNLTEEEAKKELALVN
jgi:phenylalanyl-tRNA synthetase beta chain